MAKIDWVKVKLIADEILGDLMYGERILNVELFRAPKSFSTFLLEDYELIEFAPGPIEAKLKGNLKANITEKGKKALELGGVAKYENWLEQEKTAEEESKIALRKLPVAQLKGIKDAKLLGIIANVIAGLALIIACVALAKSGFH